MKALDCVITVEAFCGAELFSRMGGTERDQQIYAELASYTLTHGDPGFIHQLVVDADTAQHAGPETKPVAVAFALAGLYLHLEHGFSGKQIQRAHMRLARRKQRWPRFALPSDRGEVTVAGVVAVPPGKERDAAIERWCASVWRSWESTHERVAEWLKLELDVERPEEPNRRP